PLQSLASSAAQTAPTSLSEQLSSVSAPTVQEPASLPEASAQPATAQSHYINRELSQLDFDERVLAIAQDKSLPLLERVRFLAAEFRARIFPVLTPLAVDPAHPFPYISHLSLNLAVMVRDPVRHQMRFARVKVPPLLPRFIPLPDGRHFVPLEQVIAAHLDMLFPGMEIVSQHPFRVTRDADLDLVDEDAADLLAAIQSE